MNVRERFLAIMNYQPVDSLPVLSLEPYEIPVLQRWHGEGLPADMSPEQFLKMDERVLVPLSLYPRPEFEPRVISEDADHRVFVDFMGSTVRCRKEAPTMYYGHIDHPVKTRSGWDRYAKRFVPKLSDRLPPDWDAEAIRRLNTAPNPVGINLFPFFFRLGFYTLGMERFLTAFYEDPGLIHAMFSFWTNFIIKLIRPLLSVLKVDFVLFAEDLAYKTSSHVSPDVYEKFWIPYQDPIVRLLQDHHVPVICLWSAGTISPLLPILLDHGFNCTWPLERQAYGTDPAALRRRYGRRLRMGGNIAKEALIAGPEAIDQEITRLMPMIREGGFIPALDDMVPQEVPFAHYRYLVDALRSIRIT